MRRNAADFLARCFLPVPALVSEALSSTNFDAGGGGSSVASWLGARVLSVGDGGGLYFTTLHQVEGNQTPDQQRRRGAALEI